MVAQSGGGDGIMVSPDVVFGRVEAGGLVCCRAIRAAMASLVFNADSVAFITAPKTSATYGPSGL